MTEHMIIVEVETEYGYRFWTNPAPESTISLADIMMKGDALSDWCCANHCPACEMEAVNA